MTREKESLSDPKAMRALAHPARLAILSRLGAGGSVTATDVAEEAGITPSAASYHLRMLAKYGFVEDAPPRGDGRERLWKAADKSFAVGRLPDDRPEVREAKDLLIQAFRKEADEEARRALAGLDREPEEWREATRFGRTILRVDAAELARLAQEIDKLLQPYMARHRPPDAAPPGARVAEAQVNLFPHARRPVPGLPTEDHDTV
ncbi:ArsR/SmtB family transcription factor [Nonomuraea rhodomycinica]|uniref:Helix-turn-helix transcriptional regulator n=1 Tax=Nonomuraea rhodomycinica TaxID=1712872 RepID=A0A7Y6IYY5_9ACTN|nr:winged helix-turn-helix domain-containing protein [Nonomuraea rhodomycinica]NUW46710.1 helix-turn-helix transcriptional regulator [Nonomuraea rhodomycinica]